MMHKLQVVASPVNDPNAIRRIDMTVETFMLYTEDSQNYFVGAEEEEDLLTGFHAPTKRMFREVIPKMRHKLTEWYAQHLPIHGTSENPALTCIYLGTDVGTIYAAYYTAVAGHPYALDVDDVKCLGGESVWTKSHPQIINRLLTTIFSCAESVHCSNATGVEFLRKNFPRIPPDRFKLAFSTRPADVKIS